MFKPSRLALPIAISLSLSSTQVSAAGCYPAYSPSATYTANSLVSFESINYQCSTQYSGWCSGNSPPPADKWVNSLGSQAWLKLGACSGTAPVPKPTSKPTPAVWSNVGCPAAFVAGTSYDVGTTVSLDGIVYKCRAAGGSSTYCGSKGFEPASGMYWTQAWDVLGSCSGSISPTSSPVYSIGEWSGKGCPAPFDEGRDEYEPLEKASWNGLALECKPFPYSEWCSKESYWPGATHMNEAWNILGTCEGTIAPTGTPTVNPNAPGCPSQYDPAVEYEALDSVAIGSLVYQCTTGALAGYCKYYPESSIGALGWFKKGSCQGTITPTTSPIRSPANQWDGKGCPPDYDVDTVSTYQSGDRVTLNNVVYECKTGALGGYCTNKNYTPGTTAGDMGWTKLGWCEGTIQPTTSPVRSPAQMIGGCPKAYVAGEDYVAGDIVTVGGVDVYECVEDIHLSKYCSQEAYAPGTLAGAYGWTKKGWCDGTIAPTTSPTIPSDAPGCPLAYSTSIAYNGGDTCEVGGLVYQCRTDYRGAWCNAGPAYAPGSSNSDYAWEKLGSCVGTISPTTSPVHSGPDSGGCNHPYRLADLDTYKAGVRVEYNQYIFECVSDIHLSKYCSQSSYGPNGIYWSMGWKKIGWCDGTLAPTKSPSAAPSVAPSVAPSLKPSAFPSSAPSLKPSASPSDEPSTSPTPKPTPLTRRLGASP